MHCHCPCFFRVTPGVADLTDIEGGEGVRLLLPRQQSYDLHSRERGQAQRDGCIPHDRHR